MIHNEIDGKKRLIYGFSKTGREALSLHELFLDLHKPFLSRLMVCWSVVRAKCTIAERKKSKVGPPYGS